jgi:hypothetical protein
MKDEIWKDIPGYEGLYKVSNKGRVYRLPRVIMRSNGHPQSLRGMIMKPQDNNRGYRYVILYAGIGEKQKMYLHRAVASAFIEKPIGKDCVDHIDNYPKNNSVENLQWVTHKENMNLMEERGRRKYSDAWYLQQSGKSKRRAVIATSVDTGEETLFPGAYEAERLGFQGSNIAKCCNGEREFHKGYYWRYAE